jgi:uncharacterized DUF497 family protein
MRIEFDPVKSAKSKRERGLPFADAASLFNHPRLEWEDRRKDYGEIRISTLRGIECRVFLVTFTRREEAIRIISFRKANTKETWLYHQHFGK